MAVDAAAEPRPTATRTIIAALKDALGAALLALGLAVPILALRTEQNISNELILQPRWGYVGAAVALAFAARLLYLLAPALPRLHMPSRADNRRRRAPLKTSRKPRTRRGSSWTGSAGCGAAESAGFSQIAARRRA